MWDVKTTLKDIAIIWNKIYLTATALMLSLFSFLYTSKDIPSILSYPFCIYETKSHKTVQSNPRPNVTTEAAQPYSFHFIFQVILLHLHSSFGYKIHIYATRDTMYKSKERTFVHSSRTQWFTTGLWEFRASRKFPGPSQKGDSVCMLTLPFSKALTKAPSRGKMRLLARYVDMRRKGGIVGAALLRLKRLVDCGQL